MRRALLLGLGVVVGAAAMIYVLGTYGDTVLDRIEERWRFV